MSDKNSHNNSRLSGASSPEAPPTSNGHTPTIKQPFSMDNSSGATITKNNANSGTGDNKPRRSSPESDAVTSSDEESEQRRLGLAPPGLGGISQLSSRRPSYAAEFHTRQRPYSLSGNGAPLSPTTSHPNTPGDTVWAPGVSPNPSHGTPSGNASLAPFWGGGSIWNQEPSRKTPPKSLNVAPPMGGGSNPSPLFAGSEALPSPTSMPTNNAGEFPLAIPLHPQFRTYRSMSFSVGQNDNEDQNRTRLSPPAVPLGGSRPPQTKGLQHRPSRPSLLSEEQFPGSSSPLRSVFETEDDEAMKASENAQIQAAGNYYQAQMAIYSRSKYDAMRLRNRSASAATIPTLNLGLGPGFGPKDGDRIDEYESALAEEDDPDYAQFHAEQRRFSEVPRAMSLMYTPAETQRLEMLRRQHWATNGAFGRPDLGPQSRRHSFAGGLPMAEQEPEFGLGGSDLLGKRTENGMSLGSRGNNYLSLTDVSNFDSTRKDALYFNDENRLRTRQSFSHASSAALGPSPGTPPSHHHHMQQMQSYALSGRNSPPNRSMMGLPIHTQTRSQQLLYFVTFKACRGDVFYVQEGTGLRVRVGDLVIVEADRGTDLGTVIAENITWQKAKEMKEQYAKEQYTVLMMYASRRATTPGITAPAAPGGGNMGGSGGFSNANGAMPNHGQQQGQEAAPAELKPKMIKRLAQPHEIQTLRDKEANEAKAKRVCQQKVLEHRLPMEILDAEFQMYVLDVFCGGDS